MPGTVPVIKIRRPIQYFQIPCYVSRNGRHSGESEAIPAKFPNNRYFYNSLTSFSETPSRDSAKTVEFYSTLAPADLTKSSILSISLQAIAFASWMKQDLLLISFELRNGKTKQPPSLTSLQCKRERKGELAWNMTIILAADCQ